MSSFAIANDDDNNIDYFKGKEELPSFIYNNTQNMVCGVSDPAMDTDTARKQAVTRAIFLYALQKNAGLKMITDFYSKNTTLSNSYDHKREKYMTLANINISPVSYRYKILDECKNDRGETYVCVQICENADSSLTVAANCDFMSSYDYDSHESSEYKVLMTVTASNENVCDTMDYSFKGKLNNPIVSSKYADHDKFYNRQAYWYYDEGTSNDKSKMYTLKNAMWCALVESLCDNIVSTVSDDSQVKNMNESFNDVNQTMSRELVKCKVSCVPVFNGIKENKISIDWKVQTHD